MNMVLEIIYENGAYIVKGKLDKANLHIFNKRFFNIFGKKDNVIININQLKGIDRAGVNALTQLHNNALKQGKKISIIGLDNKPLANQITEHSAA